jgi:hypothetical protein
VTNNEPCINEQRLLTTAALHRLAREVIAAEVRQLTAEHLLWGAHRRANVQRLFGQAR